MDNLPKDPPDENNNPSGNNSTPPSFGSNFNPHTNPVDPNNPYQTSSQPPQNPVPINNPDLSVHEEIAQHRLRDAEGHFLPYKHPNTNPPPTSPSPNPSPPSKPSPIQVIHGEGGSNDKSDDSLVQGGFKITNPFAAFFNWIKRFIKNQNVKITIPAFTFIGLGVALAGGGGIIGGALVYFFPHNSPVFHREVVYQGNLQRSDQGFFLTLPNSDLYTLRPKAKSSINFQSLTNGPALVKGNLTVEKFVIDVTEIIPLGSNYSSNSLNTQTPPTSLNSINSPTSSNIPNQDLLPKLYTGLQWEKTERKVLLFTSGKRRIEQEGVYLESSQVTNFPQAFLDYYTQELTNANFKQTLNSSEPNGTTITYAKDDLFLTFGIKNIYTGSGDNKKIAGYKAFIEHN